MTSEPPATSREDYADRLLRLPVAEYDRRRTGDLMSRVGADTTLLRATVTSGVVEVAGSAVLGTLVNLAAGFVVLFLAGRDVLAALFPGAARYAGLLPALGAAGLVAVPILLPVAARVAGGLGSDAGLDGFVPGDAGQDA